MKVLAVRLPAKCPLACGICCSPDHTLGDPFAVSEAVKENLGDFDLVYVTSRGETGYYLFYREMQFAAQQAGVAFCPLGATKKSLVPGSPWTEISIHEGYEFLASRAIHEARASGIVPIASVVWNGFDDVDLERIGDEYRVDAVLFRALRKEGKSQRAGGISRVWRRANTDLRGWKPIRAYPGLDNLDGYEPVCIDTAGQFVPIFLP